MEDLTPANIRITRLPVNPGPAGWLKLLPEAGPPHPLESDIDTDWLVIGAGFAGLAAARRLAQRCPDQRIVVLEALRVAEGPAGRNSGFMIDLPHDLASDDYGGGVDSDREQIRLNRVAIDFAADAAREYAMDSEAFSRRGKINAAATDKGIAHNRSYARHLEDLGEEHRFLDADEMHALTGTRYYRGGLYTPGAAMIQPALFTRGLAAGLVAARVRLHEGSPVTSLQRSAGRWRATTRGGSVSAARVILAVNGHVESFGFFRRRLMHVFTYASMTRALAAPENDALGGAPTWDATPADPMGTTVRRIRGTGGDRIVVRNRFTFDPAMQVSEGRLASVARDHDRAFAARFPMLRGVTMEYRWGGMLCLSRNNVHAFGQLQPGLYSACCQNGLGAAKGTLLGILAADLASGHASEAVAALLRQPMPAKLPPAALARIGANAFLRWSEYRAGKEL